MLLDYLDLADASGTPVRFHGDGEPNRRVTKVTGLPGLGNAGPRVSKYPAPSRHGSINRTRWLNGGLVTIEGILNGASEAETQAQYDEIVVPLLDAVDQDALVTWPRPDGVALQAVARLESEINLDVVTGRLWRYQASLSLDDPRGYTQAETTAIGGTLATAGGDTFPDVFPDTFAQSTSGSAAVNNIGTRPTPPTLRIYGVCENPRLMIVDRPEATIALSGTVGAGDYVEIDVRERTVKLNGASPTPGLIDSSRTNWAAFELPGGTSTVRLLAVSNDVVARVDVLYRSAFA